MPCSRMEAASSSRLSSAMPWRGCDGLGRMESIGRNSGPPLAAPFCPPGINASKPFPNPLFLAIVIRLFFRHRNLDTVALEDFTRERGIGFCGRGFGRENGNRLSERSEEHT